MSELIINTQIIQKDGEINDVISQDQSIIEDIKDCSVSIMRIPADRVTPQSQLWTSIPTPADVSSQGVKFVRIKLLEGTDFQLRVSSSGTSYIISALEDITLHAAGNSSIGNYGGISIRNLNTKEIKVKIITGVKV